MKTITTAIFVALLSLVATLAKAEEGIQFFFGTWEEVLAKAKAENKPVFVDVYTDWCGPCKQMDKDIFPLKDVAAKFNDHFINYKLNAEKGEGVKIAKEFDVRAFPTYLFVRSDGVLSYRTGGSMSARNFLQEADTALAEVKDPKPLAVWEKEYSAKKMDKAFLFQYLQKRHKLQLVSAEVLDQYASVASKEELLSKEMMPVLLHNPNQRVHVDGAFYTFLVQNRDEVIKAWGEPAEVIDMNLVRFTETDLDRAVEKRDAALMEKILAIRLANPFQRGIMTSDWTAEQFRMRFYAKTENEPELIKVLERYSHKLLKFDRKKIKAADADNLKHFEEWIKDYAPKDMSPEAIERDRKYNRTRASSDYAYLVREPAENALRAVNDKKVLKEALQWIQVAETYSSNFTLYEVHAGLLHKLGRTAEAIAEQNKAIAAFDTITTPAAHLRVRLIDNLEKMKTGEPTWLPEKAPVTIMTTPTTGK